MLADDLGFGDPACYGSRTIRTPHLDRMAAEGLRLESCYAAAPVCSPSRAGFLYPDAPKRGEALYRANVTNLDRGERIDRAQRDGERLEDLSRRLTALHAEVVAEGPDWDAR